jgi:DNA repair exonuclease SbcCD nuclease subunit
MNSPRYRSLLWTAASLALPGALLADTIIMKDGKKYENAKVLTETPVSVTFDYIVVGKIHDTRTEQKDVVAQIIRQRPEEMAWTELKGKLTLPMPDMSTADKYESVAQDSLRPFIAKFPGTAEAKEAEALITSLMEEKERVKAGELKVDGQWLSAEMVKRDARNIEAFTAWKEIRDLLAAGKIADGLNLWDKFCGGENSFTDTMHYVKAVPVVIEAIGKYETQLRSMVTEQPMLKKRRDEVLKSMVEPDLSRMKNAIDKEMAEYTAAATEAGQLNKDWKPVNKFELKGLQEALKTAVKAKTDLVALDLKQVAEHNQAMQEARHFISEKNVEMAETALEKIGRNAPRGLASALSELRGELGRLRSEMSRNKAKERIYGRPTLPNLNMKGDDAKAGDRVAAAMADAAEGKSSAAAELDKAGKAVLDAEKAAKDAKAKASGTAAKATPAKGATTRAKYSYATEGAVEEEGGMSPMMIGGGLLALALGGFLFMQKRKQNQ